MKSSNDKRGDEESYEESKKRNADNTQGGNWKKKFKKAMRSEKGLASDEKNHFGNFLHIKFA